MSMKDNFRNPKGFMKADYKDWMPKGMIHAALAVTVTALRLALVFAWTSFLTGPVKIVLVIIFAAVIAGAVGVAFAVRKKDASNGADENKAEPADKDPGPVDENDEKQ